VNSIKDIVNCIFTINVIMLTLMILAMFADAGADAPMTDEVCYEPYGDSVDFEFEAEQALVKISWVDPGDLEDGVEAESSYYYDEETNTTICLILAPRPVFVLGDPLMDALGHELLHCLAGEFHNE